MHDIVETIDLKEFLLNTHSSLLAKQNGKNSQIVSEKKKSALSAFAKQGFPTIKNEEWKYTNLSSILKKDFSFESESTVDQKVIESIRIPGLEANTFVFVNGVFSKNLSVFLDKEAHLNVRNFT